MNPPILIGLQATSYLLFFLSGIGVAWLVAKKVVQVKDKARENLEMGEEGEFVKVGEISLGSRKFDASELGGMLLNLLKDDDVKQYLEVIPAKKRGGSYTG